MQNSEPYDFHPQLRLRYALLKGTDRESRFVDDVETGLRCNCVCPCCGKDVIAKNQGKKKEHHFAHAKGADCAGARMTALHMLAQNVLEERKQVLLPPYDGEYYQKDAILKKFDYIDLEETCKNEDSTRRPDCIGYNDGKPQKLWIEIYCRHKIDDAKKADIIKRKQYCVEIDFSDLLKKDYTREDVECRLMEDSSHSKWICCPAWDQKEEQLKKKEEERQEQIRQQEHEERKKQIAAAREYDKKVNEERVRLYDVFRKWDVKKDVTTTEELLQELKKNPFHKGGACICEYLMPEGRWLRFINNLPCNNIGRKIFYSVLHYYNQPNLYAGDNIKDVLTIKDDLTKLIEHNKELSSAKKIYLEYLVVLYVLHLINSYKLSSNQECNLNKLIIHDFDIRQLLLRIILKYGWRPVLEKEETQKRIGQEVEGVKGGDAVLQIIKTCFPRTDSYGFSYERHGFDKELEGKSENLLWKELNKQFGN